jgi:hypothetical protein
MSTVEGVAEGVFTTSGEFTVTVRGEAVFAVTGDNALSVREAQ